MAAEERTSGQWWNTPGEMITKSLVEVENMAFNALTLAGADPRDARYFARIHIDKALQGDHERGLAMLATQIGDARRGQIDLRAKSIVLRDTKAVAVVGGEPRASAKLVCGFAAGIAIDKAREFGVGCVAARSKAEILPPFLEDASAQGMIALVMAQSVPMVAPHGGAVPVLGNAPIGWAIPGAPEGPIIVDMSLTNTSAKGVVRAAEMGHLVQEGLLLDDEGEPTIDPRRFGDPRNVALDARRGSLLPLGGSHKGYALVFITGLLVPLLADTKFAWHLGDVADDPGDFGAVFITINPAAFGARQGIAGRVRQYIQHLRLVRKRRDVKAILYPGERSQQLKCKRRAEGTILVPLDHYQALKLACG